MPAELPDRVPARLSNSAVAKAFRGVSLGFALLATLPGTAAAATSGLAGGCEDHAVERRAVVELYTSEGCSSCPPADRWLAALAGSGLADRVVPLSLHVDYWDRIGWPDRFADARFTKRQRAIAVSNRLRTIYTPQVVLDGRDTPRWYRGDDFVARLQAQLGEPPPLALRLTASPDGNEIALTVEVDRDEGRLPAGWTLVAGLTQDNLETAVERGENAGRRLRHDRVVRAWVDDLSPRDGRVELRLPRPTDLGGRHVRAFAFAQTREYEPLQAAACLMGDGA